jgi:hypothetical protein
LPIDESDDGTTSAIEITKFTEYEDLGDMRLDRENRCRRRIRITNDPDINKINYAVITQIDGDCSDKVKKMLGMILVQEYKVSDHPEIYYENNFEAFKPYLTQQKIITKPENKKWSDEP